MSREEAIGAIYYWTGAKTAYEHCLAIPDLGPDYIKAIGVMQAECNAKIAEAKAVVNA